MRHLGLSIALMVLALGLAMAIVMPKLQTQGSFAGLVSVANDFLHPRHQVHTLYSNSNMIFEAIEARGRLASEQHVRI